MITELFFRGPLTVIGFYYDGPPWVFLLILVGLGAALFRVFECLAWCSQGKRRKNYWAATRTQRESAITVIERIFVRQIRS